MNAGALTSLQLDALGEVGNIGAGHAATALSQLVDKPIGLDAPVVEVVDLEDVVSIFGGAERFVGAVYSRLMGDISGGILFMTGQDTALALVDLMHSRDIGTTKSIGHDEQALFKHVASILISAYLAAIARMAGIDVLPSSPALSFDMAGALLQTVVAEVDMKAEKALFVRASFLDEGAAVEAALFFVPNPESLAVILGRLGMA